MDKYPTGGDRFSAEGLKMLCSAGWFPGRNVSEQCGRWMRELEGFGYVPITQAQSFLEEFGGLQIVQREGSPSGQLPVIFDPLIVLANREYAHLVKEPFDDFAAALGEDLYPVGANLDCHYYLAISESGKMFVLQDDMQMIGLDVAEAFETLRNGGFLMELDFYYDDAGNIVRRYRSR